MEKKVGIILLNYKGVKDTIECVKSLEKISYKNLHIIIVDNHSQDGSYEKLKNSLDSKHIIIEAKANGGFAKGNNIGIDYALKMGCDYILLLNNDTLVEKDFLTELVNCYEVHKDAGIVGCKILYESKRDLIWYAGGEINLKRFYGFHYGEGQKDSGEFNREKEISFTTGCVMLIGRDVLEKVGKLPEEYFMYYEDVDYCLTVQEAEYKIYYCPSAVVYHKVSASSGGEASAFAIKWNTRNRIIFMNKFKYKVSKPSYIIGKLFFYSTRVIKLMEYYIKGDADKGKALLTGIKEGRKYNSHTYI
jgi:GT2 family glycosyltransferase